MIKLCKLIYYVICQISSLASIPQVQITIALIIAVSEASLILRVVSCIHIQCHITDKSSPAEGVAAHLRHLPSPVLSTFTYSNLELCNAQEVYCHKKILYTPLEFW